jgi:general secretion pathway protein A
MDYFQLLRLNKEPFSNSPDPAFFYPSKQHAGCLQKLEIAIRLKRGLNVVIGDVGTGKTTLCRHIVQRFASDSNVQIYLILDPGFKNSLEFLTEIARLLGLIDDDDNLDEWAIKERIKKYLYTEGVKHDKIIAIIIDEGQKIPYFCLELLREFLNYETNDQKLLQIIIFAQKEFNSILATHANFTDRVNICHELEPLGFFDTIKKIQFRLSKASEGRVPPNIFTWPAFWAIYVATRGYPRKILHLCHLVLLGLIIQNKTRASYSLVRSCIKRDASGRYYKINKFKRLILVLIFSISFGWLYQKNFPEPVKSAVLQKIDQWFGIPGMKSEKEFVKPGPSLQSFKTNKIDKPPVILGKITCLRHESLQDLIHLFYGTYNLWYLRYVKMVNPHLNDPMTIERGETVHFPGVPVTQSINKETIDQNQWWIELSSFKNIHAAYTYYINYPNDAPEVAIIPYWNKSDGLTFSVLYAKSFHDQAVAVQFINQLPQLISQNCRIRNNWGDGSTFFSKQILDISH